MCNTYSLKQKIVTEGEEKEKGVEETFETTRTGSFLKLMLNTKLLIQEAHKHTKYDKYQKKLYLGTLLLKTKQNTTENKR